MNEFLKSILDGINLWVGNYGWSVCLFTLLIRVICFPFDYKSRVSMRKTQKIQPKLNELQKKYKDDQEKLQRKTSELYKKEGISPLSSCLPMLITLPILWCMFSAMRMVAYEHLAQQTFDILQGKEPVLENWLWIKNIWMPDSPFSIAWPDYSTLRIVTASSWREAFAALDPAVIANLPAISNDYASITEWTSELFSDANYSNTVQAITTYMQTLPGYVSVSEAVPGMSNLNLWITTLTVYKNFNGLFLLPIMAALSQLAMTILQPGTNQPQQQNPNDPNGCSSNMMKWFFPLFSLWICSSYNAVFAIYWVVSNVIATLQNVGINMYLDHKEKKASAITVEGNVK